VNQQPLEDPLIKATDLSFAYRASSKGFHAKEPDAVIENINFSICRGDTLGIIGRNGVGKSTLLRVLAGVFAPSSGDLRIASNTTTGLLALGVGFNGFLTGRDNAILSALLMGYRKSTAEDHLEEVKAFSELGDAFERPVRTYSSGMKSRLSFSTLLHLDIDVLLIDEVLAVGDGHFSRKAKAALRERILGHQTVVLVSHSLADVTELCDQAIWLSANTMKMVGPTAAVVEAYRSSL